MAKQDHDQGLPGLHDAFFPYPDGCYLNLGAGLETTHLDQRAWRGWRVDRGEFAAWDGTLESILPEVTDVPPCVDFLCIGGAPEALEILSGFGWDERFAKMITAEGASAEIRELMRRLGYRLVQQDADADHFVIGNSEISPRSAASKIDVFAEYHAFGNRIRDAEIEEAILENLDCETVATSFLVCWDDVPPPAIRDREKCQLIELPGRPTTQQLFDLADQRSRSRVKVLCNSDIELSGDFSRLSRWIGDAEFYSLVRVEDDGRFNPRRGYDCWCWSGRCRVTGADFELGRLNCDLRLNQLAYEAYGDGLSNPSESFVVYHHHASLLRPGTSNLATRSQKTVAGQGRKLPIRRHPLDPRRGD